ncbi:signal peptide peptidase-like 2B isoform X3 [Thamnophis elegans]|nr:signal peptide peptidase-like 2B isoform X3 [Thamnophis elegans]
MLDIGQSFGPSAKVAMYAPGEPVLDYNMVIIFVMAVGTVAVGGYWAGSRDVKKRYMKHKRDDGAEKQEDETVDVTPVMIGVFVLMCCSMLILLYYFYDQLVYAIIGIFCLAASIGLYSCLSPFVRRFPLGKCRVPSNNWPYFHKRPQVRMLLLAAFCVAVSLVWGLFRNEDQWAWILQDALGIAFCLYMLKTIRLPTFKGCTLLLLVLFVYDVFFVFITPYLTKTGESIMVQVAAGPTDSSTREKASRGCHPRAGGEESLLKTGRGGGRVRDMGGGGGRLGFPKNAKATVGARKGGVGRTGVLLGLPVQKALGSPPPCSECSTHRQTHTHTALCVLPSLPWSPLCEGAGLSFLGSSLGGEAGFRSRRILREGGAWEQWEKASPEGAVSCGLGEVGTAKGIAGELIHSLRLPGAFHASDALGSLGQACLLSSGLPPLSRSLAKPLARQAQALNAGGGGGERPCRRAIASSGWPWEGPLGGPGRRVAGAGSPCGEKPTVGQSGPSSTFPVGQGN